ncbi:MAG: translation elongation factor-like protein [Armatimonadetes bacterium]|nr:translation elongation factor-like protein [Armatimonadota bacterium]
MIWVVCDLIMFVGVTEMEEKIGKVTHYYSKLGVAAIEIKRGSLRKGDRIHIHGHTTDVEQNVDSMELQNQQILEAAEGENVGVRVVDHVRENDDVYKSYI